MGKIIIMKQTLEHSISLNKEIPGTEGKLFDTIKKSDLIYYKERT